jgi:uncharacterized CHY-type Zn-finger protein
MPVIYDEDTDVAVRSDHEDAESEDKPSRSRRDERIICPNCRMLLSVLETRIGKCRSCHTEVETASA